MHDIQIYDKVSIKVHDMIDVANERPACLKPRNSRRFILIKDRYVVIFVMLQENALSNSIRPSPGVWHCQLYQCES
jgi:hypothetical protein